MTGPEPEPVPGMEALVMLGQVGIMLIVAGGAFVLLGATAASVVVGGLGVVLVVGTLAVPMVAGLLFVLLLVGGSGEQRDGPEMEQPGPGVGVRWQGGTGRDRYGLAPGDVDWDGFDDERGRW